MNWKSILIVGLGILSIVVLYYCYKRYYNEEGFQEDKRIVSSETFIGSSALTRQYTFSGSIITVREIYSEIIRFLTDYRNYSGYANASMYTYNSSKYKKNLTIVDFSYLITGGGRRNGQYWFPYTGQYGASSDWLTNFSEETTARIDLDIYNNNLSNYISFIKRYSSVNKQKFIFNRSLVRPSQLYKGLDLTQPPTSYNLLNNLGDIIDTEITRVAGFDSNHQSWLANFQTYARPNKNLYPASDDSRDTLYRVFYTGDPVTDDKPPTRTYSNINGSKKAGEIVNLIPDRSRDIIDEQLMLNVYGGELIPEQINDFKECMFLGSVFTNFDDQYNLDTILRVPYNEIIDGSNCYYSFNMFLPELTPTINAANKLEYLPTDGMTYNTSLVSLRSGNTIKKLTDTELRLDSNTFITNVKTVFPSKSFQTIATSNEAYVGKITPTMMAKIPSLARRYITSWIFNRSTRYLAMHLNDVTGSVTSNELKKAQYISLAIRNFSGTNLNDFLSIYANYASYTSATGTFASDATISNVPNEEAAKRIVASSRIYNSYRYTTGSKILELSKLKTVGNVFNKGTTSNYFRDADPTRSITGDLVSSLLVLSYNIEQAFLTFPTDGIKNAKRIIDALPTASTTSAFKNLLNKTELSVDYVKSIMNSINSSFLTIADELSNSLIDNAMMVIKEINKIVDSITSTGELYISNINGTTKTIGVNSVTGYSIGDYISISGTTNYNGRFYKILSINDSATKTITISSSQTANETFSGPSYPGRVNRYSLYRFIVEAQTDINALIGDSTFSTTTNEEISKAKKSIEVNKVFIDFFVNHISLIKNYINSIYKAIDTIQMINKIIVSISLIPAWDNTKTYDINEYVKLDTRKYKSIKVNKNIPVTDSTYWLELTNDYIKDYINTTKGSINTIISGTIFTNFLSDLTTIKNNATTGDTRYDALITIKNNKTVDSDDYKVAEQNIEKYTSTLPQNVNAVAIESTFIVVNNTLNSLYSIIDNLITTIGTGSIADAMAAPTAQEIQALVSDFNNLINKNKLIPTYGNLSNLNISDPSFLNSIAQLYYESSDGLYEMTTIYDVYMIGSNSIDIRFDKKQRLPKGRINNLSIQYLPEIQNYNRLLDIMEDGSWINYYKDVKYISNGQTLTSNAYDFYYQALSTATSKLEPIFNPIYPVDQNINVKDLQIELSNLNTSNNLITKILTGKLKKEERPYIPETQETVGYNYTDRLLTIQYDIQDKMYKIETQISGILQGCARVFVTPTQVGSSWKFPINGMAIGINAALSYNLAYNGNLEVDMANTQGNIGQYYPTIVYTKNFTPPIVCGDVKFINKAVALFNQTAFLNLSSFTTKITGNDITKRQQTESSAVFDANSNARKDNFYDSNDGPLYVDKILGFEQVNSNTCYYKWQETQYNPLTNGPFTTDAGVTQQRIRNVQYQFMYDNVEYQNPRLIPDNNPNGLRPNEGFKYLPNSTSVLFGDLYLSLYSWYASATRDLFGYLNELSNKYFTLYTPQYTTLVTNYNTQTSNLSTLNHSTIALFSTNLVIASNFKEMFNSMTVVNALGSGVCDSTTMKPPTFTNNYSTITYNFRPGDGYGLTTHNGFTYNKYRTVDVNDFFNNILNNNNYQHDSSKCDNALIDPENCFTADYDMCEYNANINSQTYSNIASNLIIRERIQNAINNTQSNISTITDDIKTLLTTETLALLENNIVKAAGRSMQQIYPEISNINNQITAIINDSNFTTKSIETITNTYTTLLGTQTSDRNLPIYMRDQVIPITKPLPEEAYSLDTQYGQCPSYSCTSPVVMNSLVEQYNLDKDYDDTITSILKGATPNPFQCDYLVEVRKKNAIVTNTNLQFNRIRFTPVKPLYSDNRETIYLPGNNFIKVINSCIKLESNNFTIDWFQYPFFDTNNPNPFVFTYGEGKNVSVQFVTNQSDSSTISFLLYINGNEFLTIDFNYNQLNRWSYFAIVRYNNVITCYKDGFAFISKQINLAITNSSNVYIGSDGSRIPINCFKGGIYNFSFNNYDALYMSDIFNTVPRTPIININTKFIINKNIQSVIDNEKVFINSGVTLTTPFSPSIDNTYLHKGALLREIFRGNNQNNGIAIDPSNYIYISDTANHVIKVRKANEKTYEIVVGTGVAGRSTSDVNALQASLNSPSGICFGNTLYIADTGNNRICYIQGGVQNRLYELVINLTNVSYIAYYNSFVYYVNSSTKRIGRKKVVDTFDFEADYIILPATSTPCGISFDTTGNLYIADSTNNCIYKVVVGTTTITTIITGLNKPVSVTADSSGNLYIANGDNRVYMAEYKNSAYILNHIAGDGTPSSSFNEGYARIVPIVPQRVLYHINTLYVVDSRRICSITMGSIPNPPTGYVYYFNNSSIKISSLGEYKYKFNKNLFTIQWFMYIEGSGSQTIFTFENSNSIQLGITFDIASTTKMNLHINGRVYPYNSQTNISTPIEFINDEIIGLWTHMGIVHNGSTLFIYKNSILIYSLDSTSLSFNSIPSQLTIGNRLTPTATSGFKGQMRSFMIYNKLAKNYNNVVESYTSDSFPCAPNLVLHLANGTNNMEDFSITETDIFTNSIRSINSYPYNSNYNAFKLKLYYNNNTTQEIEYSGAPYLTTPFITNLGAMNSITSFNIYSLSYEKSIQQWLLEGSSDGTTWYTLHQQSIPYTSRSSPIYPSVNTYSSQFPILAQRNVGGDIVKMTKSFQVATIIDNCSYVITSNVTDEGYTKGVTSSNAFFIQDNTPYVEDTSGSDVSGFQFIGNLLGDYQSNIQSLYDPIISDSSNIMNKMSNAYKQTQSDTSIAVGKLNTLNFYSTKFNSYNSLRTYMSNSDNIRFINTIFDGYSDSNSYMSNILRFDIVDSSNIDIIFNKVDLTGLTLTSLPTNYASRTTTAGARYTLAVTPGFLDLTATFVSNVTPTSNIFNDDYTNLNNSRAITYKDRLNQRAKLVAGIRIPLLDVTTSPLQTDINEIERLTGLTSINTSNIIDSTTNKIEYMLSNNGTLPISKRNYIVQYVSINEVNSVIPATLDNTSFKANISVADIGTLISNFKTYFNELYVSNNDNGYPYTSIMKKVYGYSIVSNILYLSCGIEYKVGDNIYYKKIPNIEEFKTELYYKVVFKTGNEVLAFEKTLSTTVGTLTDYTDTTLLEIGGTTEDEIKNNYKKNILWTQIKFIPSAALSDRSSYSISQIQFFNSALIDKTKPIIVRSLSINGSIIDNFNLSLLIDGDNTRLMYKDNMNGRFFTHTYVGGEITATFKEATVVDGFSFMTGYSLTNPDKWVVQGTTDGLTWVELVKQDTAYIYSTGGKDSFYITPIFSFINNTPIALAQSGVNTANPAATTPYTRLRITPRSSSLNYQLTNIRLFNNRSVALPSLTTTGLSYLFDWQNLIKSNPMDVITYENVNNTPLIIQFTNPISFNGISFVSGIDVNKCIITWTVEASQDGNIWNIIHKEELPYSNDKTNYPHFFCRTPIFYSDSQIVETTQEKIYSTKNWPIRYVRFKPDYMYGPGRGSTFEVSHFDFFNSSTNPLALTSSTNNNLLTNITSSTLPSQLTIFRGDYFDPSTNHIDFDFGSGKNFDGFSFMSGPNINNCVQLWKLEVSIDNNIWVTSHSTNNIAYTNNYYPSPYYRLPIIFFDKNNIFQERVKYYIIANSIIYNIEIYISRISDLHYINFTTIDGLPDYSGILFRNNSAIAGNSYLSLSAFNSSTFTAESISYASIYPVSGQAPSPGSILYKLEIGSQPLLAVFNNTFAGVNGLIAYQEEIGSFPNTFNIYSNTTTESGVLFDTNSTYGLEQISRPTTLVSQGFTNYSSINYIDRFLLVTNRTFNSKLFKLIGSDNKVIPKIFYTVESNGRNTIVYLKAYIEIIGYTIKTGLYSHLSDADSWKVYGMKKNEWILLNRQDNYDIPHERSYTLPPFYFSAVVTKNSDIPDIKIVEKYYKEKINPFGKAVFKKYMFDNNKTYYMVFDEYDNNRNLIDTDLIIGFVIVKGVVKKPVMYENPDGSFDAFNLKRREMMGFWKKKIGLNLETKYLSDY